MNIKLETVSQILDIGSKKFSDSDLCFYHGTDNSYDEAYVLVAYVLKIDLLRGSLPLERVLSAEEIDQIMTFFEDRINKKIPAPYITNSAYFAGRKFYIDNRAMIPTSPFAEIITNNFSPWINFEPHNVLELCTGSGAIAISIAHQFSNCIVEAIDISNDSLDVARKNVKLHCLQERIFLNESNLFNNVNTEKKYDLIVANPPYVSINEYNELAKEFYHEPKLAFVAENNGLKIVEEILRNAAKFLSDNGVIFIEVGESANNLEQYFSTIPFTWVELYNGGSGIFTMTKDELESYF
ncbi:MAG: 50S ribosomal protein L3 N(5)-glutamine methyltransferase [Legionellales bacterium]|nr:50S ribosomal protein L3 N(5)-glutamine methyltransferase [Legionellales bacterium]